jgi:cell wall-associated NlpC family hydrolase
MPLKKAKNTAINLLARRSAASVALSLCVVLAPLTGCAQTKAPVAPVAVPVAPESNTSTTTGNSALNAIGAFVEKRSELVLQALSLLGVNYKFGGNSPETGLDCSGLVRLVFNKTLGLVLPRRSEEMTQVSQEVPAQEMQPGDLVFFNTLRKTFSHVGIYIGNGQFVHAPSKGKTVRVENMNTQYWKTRFDGARRIDGSDRAASFAASAAALPGITEQFIRNLVERSDSNDKAASSAP